MLKWFQAAVGVQAVVNQFGKRRTREDVMQAISGRYWRNLVLAMTVLAAGWMAASARAEAPMAQKQVPGFYRMMHGQFEITALFDGVLEVDTALMSNASGTELQQLLAKHYIDGNKVQMAVNMYLVNTGEHLVLIDAGCGTLFGPQRGRLVANLEAAGYRPEQVDTILLTHMHGDHAGGLADADGRMLFPRATVYVNRQESDFWLSAKEAGNAKTPFMKHAFRMAQSSAAPYRTAGKWRTFNHKDEVVPGIRAITTAGHTPGHTMFVVRSGDARFFVLGDVVISYDVQFARPDVALEFDVDPKQATLTRYKVFNLADKYKWMTAGAHLPYPGIGRIHSNGDGTYGWEPVMLVPE